jgi:hypothetical protein
MQTQNDTLFGQRVLPVKYEDGRDGELTVTQFKLKQYPAAVLALDDELALVALATGGQRGVIEALHPTSFEAAIAAVKEVNADGFFRFAARQMERAAENLKNLPPDMVEKLLQKRLTSLAPSPGLQRSVG